MHAGKIKLPLKLRQHPPFPAFPFRQFRAIGNAILTADNGMQPGAFGLKPGEGAHELRKAPVRLHPARHKCDDLRHRGQIQPGDFFQRDFRRAVEIAINTIMNDGEFLPDIPGEAAGLKMRRANGH